MITGILRDILQNEKFKLDVNFKYSMSGDVAAGMEFLHKQGKPSEFTPNLSSPVNKSCRGILDYSVPSTHPSPPNTCVDGAMDCLWTWKFKCKYKKLLILTNGKSVVSPIWNTFKHIYYTSICENVHLVCAIDILH